MVKNIINQALDEYSQQVYGPEGIAYNSPSKLQYDIDANAAAARVPSAVAEKAFPGAIGQGLGFLSDLAMPALALGSSPFYDTYQAIGRAKQANPVDTGPYAGIVDDMEVPAGPTMGQLVNAIRNENIIDSAIGRTLGAGQNLANRFSNIGTAQAAEVTPTFSNETEIVGEINGQPIYDYVDRIQRDAAANAAAKAQDLARDPFAAERARLAEAGIDPMSVGLDGGTGDPNRPSMADIAGEINENLRDLGNPTGDPRIASEEQGLSGFAGLGQVDPGFQNVLDAREARATQIANQQNPDYGQFFDAAPVNEQKRGINLGLLGMLAGPAGMLTGSNALRAIGLASNIASGRAGKALGAVGRGLGSLNRKMRGVNPDGTTRTQSQYEAARDARRTQNRIDNMLARKAAGKSYSEKNLSNLIDKQISSRADKSGKGKKSGFTNPGANSYGPHSGGGGGGGGGGGKIVCTMMNDSYGFGNFRNKIWLKHSRDLPKEYEIGYHTIFLPLVKFAKGEGKLNKAVKKTLEHIARHRTYDLKQEMKGKTHLLGRAYRKVLEPICFITGKIKSALGRG